MQLIQLILACPVCAARTRADSPVAQWVLIAASAGMLVIPFSMVTALTLWLRRQSRKPD